MDDQFDPFLDGDSQGFMMDLELTSPTPQNSQSPDITPPIELSQSRHLSSPEIQDTKSESDSDSRSIRAVSLASSSVKDESAEEMQSGASTPKAQNDHSDHMDIDDSVSLTPKANGNSRLGTHTPHAFTGLVSPTVSNSYTVANGRASRTIGQLAARQASLHINGDDGDDDFMIISPSRASPEAQRKWAQQRARRVDNDDVIFVKEEPRDEVLPDTPPVSKPREKPETDFSKIMAAQRALLKNMQSGSSSSGRRKDPPQFPTSHLQPRADSSVSAASSKPQDSTTEIPSRDPLRDIREDPEEVDQAMRDANEDHAWMHEDVEGDDEYDALIALRERLTGKEISKTITPAERMELSRVEKTIAHKERIRSAARQNAVEEEEGIFVTETPEDVANRHRRDRPRRNSGDSDEEYDVDNLDPDDEIGTMLREVLEGDGLESGEKEITKSRKPRKKRAKAAKNAREVEERLREKERAKSQKKKGRGGAAPKRTAAKGKGKAAGKKAATKSGKKRATVKNGESLLTSGQYRRYDGDDQIGQMMLEDLMSHDPITERLQNPIFNVEAEPTITGAQRKETQFQMLFNNLPSGDGSLANRRTVEGDKKALKEASRGFGYANVKAHDGKWIIKGMNSTLYHHQLLGAQWMVKRELSSQAPHGGLLADSMGLGKTVQTLACMVGNPPGPEDLKRKVKATLIVVPATVIDQWLDEIRTHAKKDAFPLIMKYQSASRLSVEILQSVDIVITSYNEVMRQFPFPNRQEREHLAQLKGGYKKWRKDAFELMGDLHHVNWYRVVLDEAQAIKNNSARTSLACQNLKAVFRWCLTGTPLLNRLEELFPYLRFLKANCGMDWKTFQKYFCDPDAPDCQSRIATLLSYTMMRRTMKTTILNRPIVTLPKPTPHIQYISFSPEEQVIYRITENRFRANLNVFFARNESRSNYTAFFVQLLRLRQCTSHPFMLERTIRESWTLEDINELKVRLGRLNGNLANKKPFYETCQMWVEESEKARQEAADKGEEYITLPFGQGDYGHNFDMYKALKTLNEKDLFQRVTCSICSDLPIEPKKTDCGHIFCDECITDHIHNLTSEGDEVLTCPSCDKIFSKVTEVEDPSKGGGDNDRGRSTSGSSKKKYKEVHKNSKGKDATGFEPHTPFSTWLELSDNNPEDFPLTASAKTTALKALLLKSFEEAPFDKVVIYVQFRTLARIVGRICHSEDWGFLYLTGDRTLEDRSKVIHKFRDEKKIKILIAGLKCGGLGLNFPWANRCISLDLWWNHAVEMQAFGRIFRIGQKKETFMTRIVVKNSVDMRMLTMQLQKLQDLEKAIHEGDEREKPNLSLNQLANLFGFLKTDADDNIVSVEPDYDDEHDMRAGSADSGAMDESP